MLFRNHADALVGPLKLEHHNHIICHELTCHRSRDKRGELPGAKCEILLNLYDA